MISIIGSPISPYVKKVLTLLIMKGVDFKVDPITPFYGNDRFTELSPLRRIPIFIDGDLILNDSSVIAQYIEETWPMPAALPNTPELRARWFEEFADSRMGDVFIWKGFVPMIVSPRVFGTQPDLAAFKTVIETEVADVMNYLESVMPPDGFLVGDFGLADISVAAMFRVMVYADWEPDSDRWPGVCAWLDRVELQPPMELATRWSDALVKVRPEKRRKVAKEIGLALTAKSLATETPRRGPMTSF